MDWREHDDETSELGHGDFACAMLLGAGLIYRVFSANGVVPSVSSISGAEQEAVVGPVIPEVTLPTLNGGQLSGLLSDSRQPISRFLMSSLALEVLL